MSRPHVTVKGQRRASSPHQGASEKLTIQWWPTSRPTPYARNARVCPESAIRKVATSITEYGFRQPIVVDAGGVIIAGHTRLLPSIEPADGRHSTGADLETWGRELFDAKGP